MRSRLPTPPRPGAVPPAVAEFTVAERQRLLDRIQQLEDRYQRDVYGLNNEGDPIGGDPAGGFANDNARLSAQLADARRLIAQVLGTGQLTRGPHEELEADLAKFLAPQNSCGAAADGS